ncbi:hypothetical protein ACHAXN_000953 [Cyclotella atomus]
MPKVVTSGRDKFKGSKANSKRSQTKYDQRDKGTVGFRSI